MVGSDEGGEPVQAKVDVWCRGDAVAGCVGEGHGSVESESEVEVKWGWSWATMLTVFGFR